MRAPINNYQNQQLNNSPPIPTSLLLVYASETGTTAAMADAVAAGIRSVDDVHLDVVRLRDGTECDPELARRCDGIVLGTPVRHRNMHHAVKRFVEEVLERLWLTDDMVGATGGVFTVGGGHGDVGAGAELCQLGLLATLAANGLVLVSHPKTTPGFDHAGGHWGPAGRTGGPKMEPLELSDAMRSAGHHHGANVARVARALAPQRGSLLARGNVSPSEEVATAFASGEFDRAAPPEGFVSGAAAGLTA